MKVYCVIELFRDDFGGDVPTLISIHANKKSANIKKDTLDDDGIWPVNHDAVVIVEEWEVLE